jgi:hypothetical protein
MQPTQVCELMSHIRGPGPPLEVAPLVLAPPPLEVAPLVLAPPPLEVEPLVLAPPPLEVEPLVLAPPPLVLELLVLELVVLAPPVPSPVQSDDVLQPGTHLLTEAQYSPCGHWSSCGVQATHMPVDVSHTGAFATPMQSLSDMQGGGASVPPSLEPAPPAPPVPCTKPY